MPPEGVEIDIVSSEPMPFLSHNSKMGKSSSKILGILLILGIISASFVCYWPTSDIFFVVDDFLWLERGKFQIINDPGSIFKSEGLYFDPLVYLSFWLNYIISGLNPIGYHLVDIVIHTINALLVAYLTSLLTQNKVAAFFSGFIFAVSFTNADSVIWPSSRVDTLSIVFYLGSICSYLSFQRRMRIGFYYLSILFFAISLSAKSTPIILPVVILTLEIAFYDKMGLKKVLIRLIPFILISGTYLILLFHNSQQITDIASSILSGFNIKGALQGLAVLFFPESLIATGENLYISLSVLFFISIMGLGIFSFSARPLSIACVMVAVIIVPLLFMPMSFVYATPSDAPYNVLGSICHRIYLGVAGFSVMVGITIAFSLEKARRHGKYLFYIVFVVLVVLFFIYGFTFIRERERLWRVQGEAVEWTVEQIKQKKYMMSKYSKIYLIGDHMGFIQSVFRLYFDNGDLIIENIESSEQVSDPDAGVLRIVKVRGSYVFW